MDAAQRVALLNPRKTASTSNTFHSDKIQPQIQGEYPKDFDHQARASPQMHTHGGGFNPTSSHHSTTIPLPRMSENQSLPDEAASTDGFTYAPNDYNPSLEQRGTNSSFEMAMDNDVQSLTTEDKKAKDAKAAVNGVSGTKKYSAKDLLSPKKKRTHDALAEENQVTNDSHDEMTGQSRHLLQQFNVGDRQHQPHKRQKSDQADDVQQDGKPKAKFGGGGKGGILGQEMKRLRDEGAAEAGPSGVVDLTADDGEDDFQVVKDVRLGPDPRREVCMGMRSCKIMADRVPAASNKILGKLTTNWPACRVTLRPQLGSGVVIEAVDGHGQPFGKLDFFTASTLTPPLKMEQMNKMRLTAILSDRPRAPDEKPGQPISKALECRVTLYAAADRVASLGRHFSQRQFFLSNPPVVEMGREVINPHVPNYKVAPKVSGSSVGRTIQMGYKERTSEEIKQDVLGMFDRLIRSEELPGKEADPSLVLTALMDHQKQALYFLCKQELPVAVNEVPSNLWKPSFRKDGTRTFYNVISGHELKNPNLPRGGIFADMMGLGKTLSILSLICSTIQEANQFGTSELPPELENEPNSLRNAKGTLIVCPKSVLSNWDEQIRAHLDNAKIKYYVYHGPKREQDIDELAKHDIVITAYTTVGSEFTSSSGNYSAISKLNWFRVVLDEAHMIRNQDTNVFKAACAILSKRRWAVTGTPIQNRLDDLGALIRFLKVYPFNEKGSFEQHFLVPFKAGDPQVVSNLHLLVGSMTLRRSKDKIDLPGRVETLERLEFSDSESALYEAFAKDSHRKLHAMIGDGRLKGRSYAHVLVNITRLRLVCAHGRELLTEDDMKLLAGTSWDTAIDLGEEAEMEQPAMTEEQVYDTFYLLRESNMDMCALCNETVGRVTEGEADEFDDEAGGDVIGYMTPCLHAICPRCVDRYKQDMAPTITKDKYGVCPICEQYNRATLPAIRQSGIEADLERRQTKKLQPTKKGGHYGGPHTKVKALVHDLLQFGEQSKELVQLGEAPIRSVVFSGWTQYLDLIEIALRDNGIRFVRLDGKMSVAARSRVMDEFKAADGTATVLLVSIKAGGQGLNFTAASKVFMMEPQFNPGVEMQAVDRVHRLGQKRDVVIKRFIMKGSFEEKIVELQKKKLELAQLAHQSGKGRGTEGIKEKMESLRSLFR